MHFSQVLLASLVSFGLQAQGIMHPGYLESSEPLLTFSPAAFVPTKNAATPFNGTVTLYASRDCEDLLGLGSTSIDVEEQSCYDDTVLGLGGFESFKFERVGRTTDPGLGLQKNSHWKLVLQALKTETCEGEKPGEKTGIKVLGLYDNASGCVNVRKDAVGKAFKFTRIGFPHI